MVYNNYLDEDYLEELYENHDLNYLKSIDKDNFKIIYDLLKKYNFDYIEDIILKYLDIFELDYKIVENKINNLIKVLGTNYVDIISQNLNYLEYIVRS